MFKKFLIPAIVGLLLSLMAIQLFWAATTDSATADEQIHILSGYATDKFSHALFDPEHPFLVKAIAALPLLTLNLTYPPAAASLTAHDKSFLTNTYPHANFWGYQFLFTLGNDAYQLLLLSRSVIILLTVGCGFFIWWWTKRLFGPIAAIAGLALFAFDPNILAHGHLANDDTAAAFVFIASLAAYYWYLKKPSYRSIIVTGIVLGLGLITKFSLLILGPAFIGLLLIWLIQPNQLQPSVFAFTAKAWQRYALGLLAIFVISYIVIWISYSLLAIFNPSANLLVAPPIGRGPWVDFWARFFPPMWEKGVGLLHVEGGRQGYLLGACFKGSRWDYFPTLLLFKTPIPTILLFVLTIYLSTKQFLSKITTKQSATSPNKSQILSTSWQIGCKILTAPSFTFWLLALPSLAYLAASANSGFNIGVRHILPVYVLLLVAASYPFSLIDWNKIKDNSQPKTKNQKLKTGFLPAFCCLLVIGTALSSLLSAPNYLSYFNLLSGEPKAIPYISNDSNVDWGQGTKQLAQYVADHHISQIAFDNFIGSGEANYLHLPYISANPSNHTFKGYLAISRSSIIEHICARSNDWGWLIDHHQPIAIISGSINLYKLE